METDKLKSYITVSPRSPLIIGQQDATIMNYPAASPKDHFVAAGYQLNDVGASPHIGETKMNT